MFSNLHCNVYIKLTYILPDINIYTSLDQLAARKHLLVARKHNVRCRGPRPRDASTYSPCPFRLRRR